MTSPVKTEHQISMFSLIFVITFVCLGGGGGRGVSALPIEGSSFEPMRNEGNIPTALSLEPLSSSSYDDSEENAEGGAEWTTTALPARRVPLPHRLPFLLPAVRPQTLRAPGQLMQSSPERAPPSSFTGNDVPKDFQCGVRPPAPRTRIVSGISSTTRWPWMVQILRKEDRELICGGTLLSDRHVITAGHCIKGVDGMSLPTDLIVRIGDHFEYQIEAHEQDLDIECMFIHPNFDPVSRKNDIAVLKLKMNEKNPIKFTKDLLPVCLPNKREFKSGTQCFVTGWGYTDFIEYYYDIWSPSLKEAKVPLLGNKLCQNLGRIYGTDLTKKMQCAGYLTGESRADTCKKDSGGPLVCQSKEGAWKLWGITSWGDNTFCEESPSFPSPGVYTRVDKYLSWINKKLDGTCPK